MTLRTLISATLLLLTPAWADTYTVYLPENIEPEQIAEKLAPLRAAVPDATCTYVHLPTRCCNPEQAQHVAKAMLAGVTHLPSLVLADEDGPYIAIPLHHLTDDSLTIAQEAAHDEHREEKAELRQYHAQLYLLYSQIGLTHKLSVAQVEQLIKDCRNLMEHNLTTQEDRQRLGFRCLYPLILRQYTLGYKGAHTPETEALLLEAIAALEAARDIDPQSTIGRQAFAERERLRMARRKARAYE